MKLIEIAFIGFIAGVLALFFLGALLLKGEQTASIKKPRTRRKR